jgi:hypothetical protein
MEKDGDNDNEEEGKDEKDEGEKDERKGVTSGPGGLHKLWHSQSLSCIVYSANLERHRYKRSEQGTWTMRIRNVQQSSRVFQVSSSGHGTIERGYAPAALLLLS